jgi:nitroreductase
MSIMDVIRTRKSVRAYDTGKNISDADMEKILEAGRLAPSAKNLQGWKFIVVKERALLKQLVPACKDQKFVAEAFAVIAGCSDHTDYLMTCGQPAYTVDLAISLEHMALMAAELGIGSCWLGAFYEDRVKELLGVPNNARIVNMLAIGYPVQDLKTITTTTRKDLNEIVRYDKWSF